MRRDLVFFYPLPPEPVYRAFVQAANQRFGKECKFEPFVKLSFGLNYSFKYNMNGGVLTVHFMPYQNGTAIDLHYTVVQLAGARYKKHAQDLTQFTDSVLGTRATTLVLDANHFLAYEQSASPVQPMQQIQSSQPVQPVQSAQPVQPVQTQEPVQYASAEVCRCDSCGREILPGAKFCAGCGKPLSQKKFCFSCGAQLNAEARFCSSCGTKQC